MASAIVSGCAAVLRQALERPGQQTSAALVKALLINGAEVIGDEFKTGFGKVNLRNSVLMALRDPEHGGYEEGGPLRQDMTVSIPVRDLKNRGLKATLVWSDARGEVLQNELELAIHRDRDHPDPDHRKAMDTKNNVLQVEWQDISASSAKIEIRAKRITFDPQFFAVGWMYTGVEGKSALIC